MKLTLHAHAKINWSLSICGERPDGYHNLDMLMQSIELCDVLSFESARFLTLTVPLSTSFSPMTSIYGVFSSCAERIL